MKIKTSKDQILFNQESAILDATEMICIVMKKQAISKKELAFRMGITQAQVTNILSGRRTLTVRLLSDVFTHLNHTLSFKAVKNES